ncbi:MAG: hypothetical protein EXR55_03130 [Dehalococcoidia bacterium]|nr:hypothetical protein [Dehalococcoidia bacterium]
MSGKRIVLLGLAQALGTALYVSLVVFLIMVADRAPGPPDGQPDAGVYWQILSVLLLFIVSASITGALVLGYPAVLALRQRVRDAVLLVGATLGWLILLLVGSLAVLAFQVALLG